MQVRVTESVVSQTKPDPTIDPDIEREDGYRIRSANLSDRQAIVDLYQSILDENLTTNWFDWKYRDIPYAEDIPIFVASTEDSVVGAAGFLPLDMHTGRETVRVVQPCDAAVHPDHRKQGLYTDILGAGLAHSTATGAAFAFDFPNPLSRATFEKHGWRPVGTRESFVRIQRPSALLDSSLAKPLDVPLRVFASILTGLRLGAFSLRRTVSEAPVDVVRVPDVSPTMLAELYRKQIPNRLHAKRDERFYGWRFRNPLGEYTSYLAYRHGTPVAAIVTGRKEVDGASVTYLMDILPFGDPQDHADVLAAILGVVTRDHRDADMIMAPGLLEEGVLERGGFLSDHQFPLSLVSESTIHGVKPLAIAPSWEIDGHALLDPEAWRMSFAEYDTP